MQHYRSPTWRHDEFRQCPFGFTTRNFHYAGKVWFVSGVVAHPRFNTANERALAKKFPASRVNRASVDAVARVATAVENARANAIAEGAQVLPQAFHELRKLNGTIMQHSERAIGEFGDSRSLLSIQGAAELMRNNFDILEALSNIEGMRSLPRDGTVNLFDLAFKMKRVYQERAASRSISINVNGVRAIIKGSQKSFPLVPAVLIENAIKYGTAYEPVLVDISKKGTRAQLIVENKSVHTIDSHQCFERGVRFANGVEGAGFGLFLAKEVVAAHYGFITCEAGNGVVRMVVDLPLKDVIP
ncbi:sensor histidine kinase [Achromobacter animicus]|uniref:sensor histidine kinase n=1 Tax=Achromobacter animicus TaxID=1389935 RepID=UPI00244C8E48|nr:HAMP domain-containing sensor histidine kinase [Achromobacter animicus]MDH0681699.1 HAMP domain-containing histidine kinase [Achromobacter animicus]